ncbi:D-inositol 3-phosphate glycosyltransferase, partial [termite gut metagenome]
TPLFFPATSLYLSQKYFKKKSMPKWMESILNSDFFLHIAASFSGTTSSEGLEEMTLSMINGNDTVFNRQVHTLIEWIKEHEQPDIIYLSTSLLIGIAKAIKREVNIPLICSLQDEEIWIDCLNKKEAEAAWNGIGENTGYVDHFTTTSEFYKQNIEKKFPQIKGKIDVIYPGVDTDKYVSGNYPQDPVIGFFYRMNEKNGLGILAEAFVKLKKRGQFDSVRLRIGGGYTSTDKKFLKKVRKTLSPYKDKVDWCNTYSLSEHAQFYKEITAICVPITFDEGVGLYLCEAFAAGCPAIEPATGSFPEIVGDAGILYTPNSSDALADAIEALLTNDELLNQCRTHALQLSATRYNKVVQAKEFISVSLLSEQTISTSISV